MDNELTTSLIGSITTILAAVIANWKGLRGRDAVAGARKSAWISVTLFGAIAASIATWALYSFSPIESYSLMGYYRDADPRNGEAYATYDKLKLKKYRNGLVEGKTTSLIRQLNGEVLEKGYLIRGFWSPTHLALSYIGDEPTPSGIGVYLLERSGNDWTGQIGIRDRRGIFLSPYGSTTETRVQSGLLPEDAFGKYWPRLSKEDITVICLTDAIPTKISVDPTEPTK